MNELGRLQVALLMSGTLLSPRDVKIRFKLYSYELGASSLCVCQVELLGYRNRIPDHIQVGHLFRNSSEAQVFAELIPSSSNTPFELPRLKLAGARNLHFVPEHELRQNFEEKLPPLPLETRGLVEGHVLPDLGEEFVRAEDCHLGQGNIAVFILYQAFMMSADFHVCLSHVRLVSNWSVR